MRTPPQNSPKRVQRQIHATLAAVTAFAAAAALAASLGCGGGQTRGHPLDRTWDDTDGAELASFLTRWSPATMPPPPGLYVGVVDDDSLVLGNLDSGRRWLFDHSLEGRPCIAGGVVVGTGGGELFALDGSTGELLWNRPSVGHLRGADDDGKTTVVSLGSLSDQRSTVLAVARDGRVVRQLDVPERVGVPAVYGDHAFLPWDDHLVVLFDLLGGRESARIVSDQPLRNAAAVDGALFFGQRELLAFDSRIVAARKGQGTILRAPPRPALTRTRRLGRAPTEQPLRATAQDTVRLYGRPQLTGSRGGKRTARVAGNRYLLATYRLAVALDATTGATRWVHVGETAFLGGAAGQHSFVLLADHEAGNVLQKDQGRAACAAELYEMCRL